MIEPINILEIFARGGGGGSGGGGSGGGGGEIFIAVGYFVGYFATKMIKKLFDDFWTVKIVSAVIMSLVTVTFTMAIFILGSFLSGYIIVLIIIGLWVGWHNQIYDVWGKLAQKIKRTDKELEVAVAKDQIWQENSFHDFAKEVFLRYQDDWTRLDISKFNEYMTPGYAKKAGLMIQALRDLGRQNAVLQPVIHRIDTVTINDSQDDNQDSFKVIIEAQAQDILLDLKTGSQLFADNNKFIELWSFVRSGNSWLLNAIDQTTADNKQADQTLIDLAHQNNLYYSLDMGWLFLSAKGQVFKGGKFGSADINNHIIGKYGDILVQLYSYISYIKRPEYQWVIGQINIPKYYGNILIRPKRSFFRFFDSSLEVGKPENSQQYSFEWDVFNKKYEVFATEADRLASFELINPKFMEMMFAVDENMVLEVVDNIIYFRVSQKTTLETYSKLLGLLKQAHKELKL